MLSDDVEVDPRIEAAYEVHMMGLIEQDASVVIPVRPLVALMSYALAGPSSDASVRNRDAAMAEMKAALAAADAVSPQPEYEQVGWLIEPTGIDYRGDGTHPEFRLYLHATIAPRGWSAVSVRREDLNQ
jgi:hypothetical protein